MEEHGLTKKQCQEIRNTFDFFDKNGDGMINVSELGAALRIAGMNPTEEEIKAIIKAIDSTGDGTIHFKEFLKMMAEKINNTDERKELRDSFKVFDRNGDGRICAQELFNALTSIGEKLSNEDVEKLLKKADIDKNGFLCYEEFVILMTDKQP